MPANASGGAWASNDRGQSWRKVFHMPLVFQVASSPRDPERIAVTAGEGGHIANLNPGAYISFDRGESWHKSNRGLGQPYWIVDLQFDLEDPDVLWCGLLGSGWHRGVVRGPAVDAAHGHPAARSGGAGV